MAINEYDFIEVAEDFQPTPLWQNLPSSNLSWNLGDLQEIRGYSYKSDGFRDKTISALQQIQQQSVNYTRLSPKECISAYSTFFLSTRRNLVLVTDSPSLANGSLLAFGGYRTDPRELSWMYNATYNTRYSPSFKYHDALPKLLANADDWRPIDYGPRIQYCLSETTPEACSLQFSFVIISIVIICNMGKTLIMAFTAFKMVWQPLITVGDGIASFLVEPDKTTKSACLLRVEDLGASSWFKFMRKSKKTRWFQSSSLRRWLVCNALYAITFSAIFVSAN